MNTTNRRIVLASRPVGEPTPADFRLEQQPVPEPGDGEVLLRTLYLSLDPYMRGRMSDAPSYAAPVAINAVMCGATVCRVENSRAEKFRTGDLVLAYSGWQDYAVSPAKGLVKLDAQGVPPSWALGILGMPGMTAYVGLLDIGQPKAGETVVVAAATGPVGSAVGQIARLKGCRAIGIAGGTEKCDYAVRELGFDLCLDHYRDDLPQQLAAACPQGIDVYFENVGGHVLQAVVPLLNVNARMPLCGVIAWYNLDRLSAGPDFTPVLMRRLLAQRVKLQGFIVSDHGARLADFQRDMAGWLREGKVRYREDVVEGLEHAPGAFIGLLKGSNFGKLVIRVSPG
ncbi:MAG TPA: NADP-dependent oxidoreductase [Nevskiaceae bacterium]|nr:NADP-dependent oxidoreductase [Nevskiaceae bacterium]